MERNSAAARGLGPSHNPQQSSSFRPPLKKFISFFSSAVRIRFGLRCVWFDWLLRREVFPFHQQFICFHSHSAIWILLIPFHLLLLDRMILRNVMLMALTYFINSSPLFTVIILFFSIHSINFMKSIEWIKKKRNLISFCLMNEMVNEINGLLLPP